MAKVEVGGLVPEEVLLAVGPMLSYDKLPL
jgi:hypothetical protein